MKQYKIGDIIDCGRYPCIKCGKKHNRRVQQVQSNGDWMLATWETKDGHIYDQMDNLPYLEILEKEIKKLIAQNKRLKKRINIRPTSSHVAASDRGTDSGD